MGHSEQLKIRKALVDEIEADLVGPRKGKTLEQRENEITTRNPQSEYYAGVFFPGDWEVADEEKTNDLGSESDPEDESDSKTAFDKLYKPSSFGFTCRLSPETKKIQVTIQYGQYQAVKDKETGYNTYHRTPLTENFPITIEAGDVTEPFKNNAKFVSKYTIIKKENQIFLDFYVINENKHKVRTPFHDILFQPKVTLESVNDEYCFIEDTLDTSVTYDPAEDEHLDILFRDKISFGKGHLCSLKWDENSIKERKINKIQTTFVPQQTIDYVTHTKPSKKLESAIDMIELGTCNNKNELRSMLEPLITEYKNWINDKKNKVQDPNFLDDTSRGIILRKIKNDADLVVARMEDGLDVITSDDKAFEAFKFANMAIAWQQTMSKWAKENVERGQVEGIDPFEANDSRWDKPKWRLFQIAFILMNLESLVNPESKHHETVDLLWFPTGGGKTEAYLGLVAFIISFRRLRGKNKDEILTDQSLGTSVLMRYTLRLLTVQQFQRAAVLMCACEKIRAGDLKKWGSIPFQVGLWVGAGVTPNNHNQAKAVKNKLIYSSKKQDLTEIKTKNPYILINCPWCGEQLKAKNGEITGEPEQWRLFCNRTKCMFSKHDDNKDRSLPVVLVDEDVYSRCPSLIIATVDKFAQIAWTDNVKAIFGKSDSYCDYCGFYDQLNTKIKHTHPEKKDKPQKWTSSVNVPPPELIIQDELHLIAGPLGTMAGLYETAVEYLCTNDEGIKPKIIASTATTRAARDQIENLFNRDITKIFPPQIAKFGETFFSGVDPDYSGKTYLGVLATGKSGLTVIARVSAAILRRIRQFEESKTYKQEDLDPYFTLVNYFNSQRELSGAAMNFKDSVPYFISQIQHHFDDMPLLPQITTNHEEISVEDSENESDSPKEPKQQEESTIDGRKIRKNQFYELETEELTARKNSGEIPEILRKLEQGITKTEKPVDLLLATNMLSVGVDISRLGVMMVNGQPKKHSEYIQATGRIGRNNPGLIINLFAYTKPRDLSHYENFKIYHSTYYKNVETVGLTPFTLRSRQVALFGVLVGMIRMKMPRLSHNNDVKYFDPKDTDQQKLIDEIKTVFENRVKSVDSIEASATMDNIRFLFNKWTNYIKLHGDILKYAEQWYEDASKEKKESYYYLLKNDLASKRQFIPAPISLRNTEQEQRLFYKQQTEVENN